MATTTTPSSHNHNQAALPLYDLFLDLPHPAGASLCPPPAIVGTPATASSSSSSSGGLEQELTSNLSRIGRFAFPEFDDADTGNNAAGGAAGTGTGTTINRFSQYAMQAKTFQQYTFSMQLQSGVRVHGHVRRYLPTHSVAQTRYDVGRRGERALVLMTRSTGGDLVYSAILKTLDAISFQQPAIASLMKKKNQQAVDPIKWFLFTLFEHHRAACGRFASLPQQDRQPMVLTIPFGESGDMTNGGGVVRVPYMDRVDTCRFLVPTTLLSPTSSVVEAITNSSILPLLRVLGIQHTMRLLSALLSESRVLLISSSPTRLAQCARSALSILAQGLLNWQHLFIPVLPPHLFQYLAAPVPYLIGMLANLTPRLDHVQGLSEMVIIHLDTCEMETRGMNPLDVANKIPDLFRAAVTEQGIPKSAMSATEMLAQDLADLLKIDKRSLYGESALTNVSETAAKAGKAVRSGFLKLRQHGKKLLTRPSSFGATDASGGGGGGDDPSAASGGTDTSGTPATPENTMTPDYIYTQGSQNEVAEEEARIAFVSFFLTMFGNMRWYLSATPGKLPELDRKRFLQQKQSMGDGEQTAIWPLLQNFCQTQMLEEFAKARVEEVRTRMPVAQDSPLFSQCANYHRTHNVDFSVVSVRRVARQVAQNDPGRRILQSAARRTAMDLTSNRTFEGDYNQAVAALVEQCREASSTLFDVMSVIWVRLRDSKGLHWKHGFQALQILRNLLYHGPLAVIAEATDGLDKIRVMKFYNDNMRSQICTQIRQVANQVYNLLVDRSKLFHIRRLCINKRRVMRKKDPGTFRKDSRMRILTPFSKLHPAFNPSSRVRIAPLPGGAQQVAPFAAEQDLLGFADSSAQPSSTIDPFAPVPPPAPAPTPEALVAAFQNATITQPVAAVPSSGNPFDLQTAIQAPSAQQGNHLAQQQQPGPATPSNVQQPAYNQHTTPIQHAVPPPAYQNHPQGATPPHPSYQQQQPPPQHYSGNSPSMGAVPGHPAAPHHQVPQQQQAASPAHMPYPNQPNSQQPYYPARTATSQPQQQQYQQPQYQQPQQGHPGPPPQQKPNVSQFDPFK